jgi:hypothetical protein
MDADPSLLLCMLYHCCIIIAPFLTRTYEHRVSWSARSCLVLCMYIQTLFAHWAATAEQSLSHCPCVLVQDEKEPDLMACRSEVLILLSLIEASVIR